MNVGALKKVAIESPFRGDEEANKAFCLNVCRYAVNKGYAPFAMHMFFTQFLNDAVEDERATGINCGLAWTDGADEIWFCLRPKENLTDGMRQALVHHKELLQQIQERSGVQRQKLRSFIFSQQGELVRELNVK